MIKIRLSRIGRPHNPIYTIMAIDSKKSQNGTCLEKLGTYDPSIEPHFKDLKVESISTWMKKGAIFSDTVKALFKKNKVNIK